MRYRVRRPDLGLLLIGVPVDAFADDDVEMRQPLFTFLLIIPDSETIEEPGTWLFDRLLERDALFAHNQRTPEKRYVRHATITAQLEPYIGAVITSEQLRRTPVDVTDEDALAMEGTDG